MSESLGYLECAHCHCEFLASRGQRHRGRDRHYCSRICQDAGIGQLRRKPPPYTGICVRCGTPFGSRYPKKYCSIKCYVGSVEFKNMQRANAGKGNAAYVLKVTGKPPQPLATVTCLNCGATWTERPSRKSRFCGHICYRQYMAGRFDRWVANPQAISLPQAFDEFLCQEELPCLIAGCDWKGRHLGAHVNLRHGIEADDFKRAAGFNLGSGLVTPDVAKALGERPHIQGGPVVNGLRFVKGHANAIQGYRSLESREHAAKTRALMQETTEMPPRICRECAIEYRPDPLGYNSKFCSLPCRTEWYRKKNKLRDVALVCAECGHGFTGSRAQQRRSLKSLPVFCNFACRQTRAARLSVWARGYQLRSPVEKEETH